MFSKVAIIVVSVFVVFLLLGPSIMNQPTQPNFSEQTQLKKFSSYGELKNFLSSKTGSYSGGYAGEAMNSIGAPVQKAASESAQPAPAATGSEDYSTTNVQVAGVDEPDIVKNDGKYIYTVSGNKVVIVDAYPADSAKILSQINAEGVRDIFVSKDSLVVFGNQYNIPEETASKIAIMPPYRYYSGSYARIYDISDRSKPVLAKNLSFDGTYLDSRMIGDYVYFIVNQPAYLQGDVVPLPRIMSVSQDASTMRQSVSVKEIPANEIYYIDYPDSSYQFTAIFALNVQNTNEDIKNKVILMGYTQSMYVSADNIYLTYMKHVSNIYMVDRIVKDVILPNVPSDVAEKINVVMNSNASEYEKSQQAMLILQEYSNTLSDEQRNALTQKMQERYVAIQDEIAKETEKTVIQKISIKDGSIEHTATGEVPGQVLNQFSMDESNGYFRIATTTHSYYFSGSIGIATTTAQQAATVQSGQSGAATGQAVAESRPASTIPRPSPQAGDMNHVYALDKDLKIVGKLEDIAKGEKIYSARFLGNRAYLVTFVKIDPLFVIDLSDPTNPQVLGQLKIPGYSDYLHPYDENHIIGIGKEAVAAEEGNFAWYQGVKISLFDVSDVSKPKEIAKYNIGDRGTDSYALHDHKAFLFDKNKNLLVIPVLLAEIDKEKYPQGVPSSAQGDYVFQGAYVFNIDLNNITLRGRITHQENDSEFKKAGFYYYGDASAVKRSLYIGNVLYTISSKLIKANDLATLSEINKVNLPYEERSYPVIY